MATDGSSNVSGRFSFDGDRYIKFADSLFVEQLELKYHKDDKTTTTGGTTKPGTGKPGTGTTTPEEEEDPGIPYYLTDEDGNPIPAELDADGNPIMPVVYRDVVISLDSGALFVGNKSVMIGSMENYIKNFIDADYKGEDFKADNTTRAQDETGRVIIDAKNQTRVFYVAAGADLHLNNMTLTNGNEKGTDYTASSRYDGLGGAIFVGGDLTMVNCVVKDSTVTNISSSIRGINVTSDNAISNSGFGGGIYVHNGGRADIFYSTITNNKAVGVYKDGVTDFAMGGGIYNNGTLNLYSSTVSGNSANGFMHNSDSHFLSGMGGGIYLNKGDAVIASSTITGNSVDHATLGKEHEGNDFVRNGSALLINGGNTLLIGNTIAYNSSYFNGSWTFVEQGYAVSVNGGVITLRNNIIAENHLLGSVDMPNRDLIINSGVFTKDSGYNIIGSLTGNTHQITSMPGNIISANQFSGEVENLNLSSQLKYNGGMTQSFRIGRDSVAVGAANYEGFEEYMFDQRGVKSDGVNQLRNTIGSYEMLTYIEVTTGEADFALENGDIKYDFGNGFGGWQTNLRTAMYLADGGEIRIAIGKDADGNDITTYNLVGGALQMFAGVNVVAENMVTISSNGASRALIIDGGSSEVPSNTTITAKLQNLKFANNATVSGSNFNGFGGAIYSNGNLVLNNVIFENNSSVTSGGSVYVVGNLTANNVKVTNSQAGVNGGAFAVVGGDVNLNKVEISNVSSGARGGAISVTDGSRTSTLTDVKINNAVSRGEGGAFFFIGSNLLMNRVEILNSTANGTTGFGGAMYVSVSGTATITNSLLDGNKATQGGAIYVSSGDMVIERTAVVNNSARYNGGGLYASNDSVSIVNSTFAFNTAGQNGGAIYSTGLDKLELLSATVAFNIAGYNSGSAALGGGIYMGTSNANSLFMVNSIVANNYHNVGTASGNTNRSDLSFESEGYWIVNPDSIYNIVGHIDGLSYDVFNSTNVVIDDSEISLWNQLMMLDELHYVKGTDADGAVYRTAVMGFSGEGLASRLIGDADALKAISVYTSVDQRGVERTIEHLTVGAYERIGNVYVLKGDMLDVTQLGNWISVTGSFGPDSFSEFDAIFMIDKDAELNKSWSVGPLSSVKVTTGGDFTISDGGNLTVPSILVNGEGLLTVSGLINGVITLANSATLELLTGNLDNVNLSINNGNTTVHYANSGNQTITNLNYDNLVISGSKNMAGSLNALSLTVNSNGSFSNSGSINVSSLVNNGKVTASGNVVVIDSAVNNGTLMAANVAIGSEFDRASLTGSGLIDVSGSVSVYGGEINYGSINARENVVIDGSSSIAIGSMNVSGNVSLVSANGDVTMNGNVNAGNISVNAHNNIVMNNATAVATGSSSYQAGKLLMNSSVIGSDEHRLNNSDIKVDGIYSVSGKNAIYLTTLDRLNNLLFDTKVDIAANSTMAFEIGGGAYLNQTIFNNVSNANGTFAVRAAGDVELEGIDTDLLSNFNGTFEVGADNLHSSTSNNFGKNVYLVIDNRGMMTVEQDFTAYRGLTVNNVHMLSNNGSLNAIDGDIVIKGILMGSDGDVNINANNVVLTHVANVADLNLNAGESITFAGMAQVDNIMNIQNADVKLNNAILNVKNRFEAQNIVSVIGVNAIAAGEFDVNNITGASDAMLMLGVNVDGHFDSESIGGSGSANKVMIDRVNGISLGILNGSFEIGSANINNLINVGNLYINTADLTGSLLNHGALKIDDFSVSGNGKQQISAGTNSYFGNVNMNKNGGRVDVLDDMTVHGNFNFANGAKGIFNVGDNSLMIEGKISGGSFESYFGTGADGWIKTNVDGSDTTMWIGNDNGGSRVIMSSASGERGVVGVNTYNPLTDNGRPDGWSLLDPSQVINRSWRFDKSFEGAVSVDLMADPKEIGANAENATLFQLGTYSWDRVAQSNNRYQINSANPVAFGMDSYSFASVRTPFGYNETQRHLDFARQWDFGFLDLNVDQWMIAKAEHERRLDGDKLTNPLNNRNGMGDNMIKPLSKFNLEDINIIKMGDSIFGTPTSADEVFLEGLSIVEEEVYDMINLLKKDAVNHEVEIMETFSALADNSDNMEKHPAFRNDVDKALDALLS
ncbi:MAG: hypothetical protein RRY34_00015 [Victivallaceae bacterium]